MSLAYSKDEPIPDTYFAAGHFVAVLDQYQL